MKHYGKIALLAAVVIAMAGCEELGMNGPGNQQFAPGTQAIGPTGQSGLFSQPTQPTGPSNLAYLAPTVVADRHNGEELSGQGGVDIALQWSNKYAQANEELLQAERDNHKLSAENQRLLMELQQLQDELAVTEQELSEANLMLADLHQELESWKRDVLSFREEMRLSQLATLNALQRIMTVLGGEVADGAGL